MAKAFTEFWEFFRVKGDVITPLSEILPVPYTLGLLACSTITESIKKLWAAPAVSFINKYPEVVGVVAEENVQ